MSNDAAVYSYINVGLGPSEVADGAAYSVWNTVSRGARNFVGKVVGFAAAPRIALAVAYANVGAGLDEVRDGAVYVVWNQLEQVSGSARTLEDGTTRHLEDGTARTLE